MEVQEDQRDLIIQRDYLDFLDDEEDSGKYALLVKNMIADDSTRIVVNVNDLRRKNPTRARDLLENAFEEQNAFQNALKEYVNTVAPDYSKEHEDFFIAFEGSFGNKHVTPRSLQCRFLGNLICVEGIVTKCSLVHPKVVRSVHYCPATKKVLDKKYSDLTSLDAFPSSAVYPTKDEDGNLLETEFGLSTYKDHQTISIQEMPEKAPAGQLPRTVDVILDNDLVDKCKPGDRVQVVGNFRCLPNRQGGFTSGVFRTIVIANNLTQLSKEANPTISHDDITRCKNLAKNNKNIFKVLAKSLAPSIHGHEYIKRAILCLLLGGVEKILPNGTRLRGDINILLIGDPSVAKSQLLRYVLCTAPRAIATTGRGSSGVGLTAAVTSDQETGERRLEAGAMVLADRGVVCIDEFDKMSDIDRTAIHEVMEQGRVTIAKAGIHASLNARCSVLAAANPVYGKYDPYKTPMENIGLQDSLLSRFDCLFVMLDTVQEEQDLMISDHVVRMHRYRSPKEQDGDVLPMGSSVDVLATRHPDYDDEERTTEMYERYDPLLHGTTRRRTEKILSVDFMRKYIHFVSILRPVLTEQASQIIADEYAKLRSEDSMENDVARTQPVTARSLETMIRLSTAHAKARMSRTVTAEDAHAAIELVQYAYFKRVLEKEKKRRRRTSTDDADNDDDDDDDEDRQEEEEGDESRVLEPRSKRTRRGGDATEVIEEEPDENGQATTEVVEEPEAQPETESMEIDLNETGTITEERLKEFKSSLFQSFREARSQSLAMTRLKDSINDSVGREVFTQGEIHAAIARMTDDNQIMMSDGIVFLI